MDKMLTLPELMERLKELDQLEIIDRLSITSEQLVDRFDDLIDDLFETLTEEADDQEGDEE